MRLLILFCGFLSFLSVPLRAEYDQVELPLGPHGEMSTLHFYRFSEKTHRLIVIDQGTKAPKYQSLESAMRANACVAGLNGGYADEAGKPLGLIIANGRVTGTPNAQHGLTSATLYAEEGKIHLVASKIFANQKTPWPRQLIQSGPFIIEDSKINPSLRPDHFARRSILGTDGKGMWFFAYVPPTSLPRLAEILQKPNAIPGMKIRNVINLSGGTSAAFWCRRDNNALYFRESKKLHSFIGVVAKEK